MDRGFSGGAWHGPSLMQLLEGLSAEDASKHPVHDVHSIWELVNHIVAWNAIVRRRIEGEIVSVTPEMDWPPVWEASEMAWKRSLELLSEGRALLRAKVEGLMENQLEAIPAGKNYTNYVMLHGLIQHDLYHAGQIAILKKALGENQKAAAI